MQTNIKFNADRRTNEIIVSVEVDSLDSFDVSTLDERIKDELASRDDLKLSGRTPGVYRISLSRDVQWIYKDGEIWLA